ncbi:MAG: serine hydrolase domain-containing protein [Pseudomonadota bacterium]
MKISRRHFAVGAGALTAGLSSGAFALASAIKATPSLDILSTHDLVDDTARSLGVVGGQVAIYDGAEVHEFMTGFANRELQQPVVADTLFQVGSTTKLFNAAIIMALVDDGQLDLDEPVEEYIKDFNLPENAERRITLRHLLSMSAGLDNGPYSDYGRGDDALSRYVAAMGEVPRIFEPGKAYGYSNASTNIAGLAAARVAGTSWETQLSERILKPLALKHSAYFAEDIILRSYAKGYYYPDASKEAVAVNAWAAPRSMAPAGSTLCCSAGDLVRFARMFLERGVNAGRNQVLSTKSIATMQTPEVKLPTTQMGDSWCTGPSHRVWSDTEIFGHSGTNSGGSSYLLWVPEHNFAIATISNVASKGYPFASKIFAEVFKQALNIEKPEPLNPNTVGRTDVDLARYTGKFEAHNQLITFSQEGKRLNARLDSTDPFSGAKETIRSEMIPLGEDRFLPAELAMSGSRNWDVAFWGSDKRGAATHFLNGVFPMRRVA